MTAPLSQRYYDISESEDKDVSKAYNLDVYHGGGDDFCSNYDDDNNNNEDEDEDEPVDDEAFQGVYTASLDYRQIL